MIRFIIIYLLSSLILSCSQTNESSNSENAHDKVEDKRIVNDRLLAFKSVYLAELGQEKFFKLEKEIDKEKIEIKYINDIIYVSYYEVLNSCGIYDGNIEIKSDSINLKIELISDEVCSSTVIEKVTFLIYNPDKKKKLIIK